MHKGERNCSRQRVFSCGKNEELWGETAGYLNLRNCSLLYSLVNPAVRPRRTGDCARYPFQEGGEDAVLPPLSYLLSLIGSIRTAQLGTAPSWAIPVRLFTFAKGKWMGT